MAKSDSRHAGIELDVLDLSILSRSENLESKNFETEANNKKVQPPDYKSFVKSLFSKIMKDASLLSFSRQVDAVNKILKMKYSSADDVAQVILNDVNLTTKLLELVNSPFYGQFATKGITTIAEAMIILGTEEIQLAAANLKIYELMNNISNIKVLKDKTIKGLQRSVIVREIALYKEYKNSEALQVSAMLYDLGEYLVALFYPDQYREIKILMDSNNIPKEEASKQILGITYSNLGRIVGLKWNLPDTIVNAMKPVKDIGTNGKQLTMQDVQRHVCAFADDICESSQTHTGRELNRALSKITRIYKKSLNIDVSKTVELLKNSWKKTDQYITVLNANLKYGRSKNKYIT
jgi:HD-like signal output (HDOD) protein